MTLTMTMLIYRWLQVKTCNVRFSNVFRVVKKIPHFVIWPHIFCIFKCFKHSKVQHVYVQVQRV